jgi:hypothetical protein
VNCCEFVRVKLTSLVLGKQKPEVSKPAVPKQATAASGVSFTAMLQKSNKTNK